MTVRMDLTGLVHYCNDIYEHLGFSITGQVQTDIGGGFVMDDYVMEYHLPASAPATGLFSPQSQ